MCLFFTMLLAGPRVASVIWWLVAPGRWDAAFNSVIWPILGIIFLPFTTLMWVIVAPTGNAYGADWIWLAFAFFGDVALHAGGGYGNRHRAPGYAT